ncbi:unnamed protein product, partial [Amoebophrya sp. A25]
SKANGTSSGGGPQLLGFADNIAGGGSPSSLAVVVDDDATVEKVAGRFLYLGGALLQGQRVQVQRDHHRIEHLEFLQLLLQQVVMSPDHGGQFLAEELRQLRDHLLAQLSQVRCEREFSIETGGVQCEVFGVDVVKSLVHFVKYSVSGLSGAALPIHVPQSTGTASDDQTVLSTDDTASRVSLLASNVLRKLCLCWEQHQGHTRPLSDFLIVNCAPAYHPDTARQMLMAEVADAQKKPAEAAENAAKDEGEKKCLAAEGGAFAITNGTTSSAPGKKPRGHDSISLSHLLVEHILKSMGDWNNPLRLELREALMALAAVGVRTQTSAFSMDLGRPLLRRSIEVIQECLRKFEKAKATSNSGSSAKNVVGSDAKGAATSSKQMRVWLCTYVPQLWHAMQ